nr:restriction endonuclease subunit S [Aeromonas media]
MLMRPTEKLLPEYLNFALKYLFQTGYWARTSKQSVNQASVNQKDISCVDISYPTSKEEQHRIVAILDEAFEAIAAARANAEQNRLNARALFESYLQSVFSQRGEGWIETTIAAATGGVFTGPFGSLLHKSDYIENGIPLVNPAHITNVGIEPDLRKTVSKATAQRLSSYIMRTGDIVIGRRGEMGRCAIVTDVEDGWLCGTGSFVIKPSDRCDARYLVRLLRSESCKNQLEKIAGGAVMPNLSNTDLSNFSIMLPPIDMQRSALDKIDTMAEETQRLESLYQRKIVALDELKQSLLQQAFSGQLDTTRQEVLTV